MQNVLMTEAGDTLIYISLNATFSIRKFWEKVFWLIVSHVCMKIFCEKFWEQILAAGLELKYDLKIRCLNGRKCLKMCRSCESKKSIVKLYYQYDPFYCFWDWML